MDISKLHIRWSNLQAKKVEIIREYEARIAEVDKEIAEETRTLERINEILSPYLCDKCDGSGEMRYTDAAGSRDSKKCDLCHGSGMKLG